ncbi:hypothetical protein SAMN04489712_1137 [Thermomonospora echinospora]|uniref:Uncharacterized protein n=1 Tax=Thermomonospora echinospora TaxID=1992 RepID=A0A1H6D473_9ACTN|nr:ankyrin repeat domain-containing protein [Thermomonospora echinospora]SEG80061.1 hypothetical protein SAMN04489712_1137 [Thermomonospora echinospora]
MRRPSLPSFPPDVAASWERVRRYAVPASMIERVAERRLAGDWRGACTAANIDITFDLAEVAAEHGRATAETLEDDLRHMAPDLIRWHLPRVDSGGHTTLAPGRLVRLASYGAQGAGPILHLVTPGMVEGPQRSKLCFAPVPPPEESDVHQEWAGLRPLWDVRRVDGLREWYGGADRIPFFHADGTPLIEDELPSEAPGPGDPAAHTEWVTRLHDRGELNTALAATRVELSVDFSGLPDWARDDPHALLARLPLALTRWEPRLRELAAEGFGTAFRFPVTWRVCATLRLQGSGPLQLRLGDNSKPSDASELTEASWQRPVDLDLLRSGRIGPDALHPLIRDALFPARAAAEIPAGPPAPEPPAPVRVRCRGEWHEVRLRGDGLRAASHSEDEQRRERALRAFGGPVTGCFAVERAWSEGTGRLPRGLREQRRELFLRVQHGDTAGVLALLDAGFDSRARDGRGRTLLHHLNKLDHEPLLSRLLAAGLGLEDVDQGDRTPLHVAVGDLGSPALVDALLAAGARVDVLDQEEQSLIDLIKRYRRTDLPALLERLMREHPELDHGWWDWMDD